MADHAEDADAVDGAGRSDPRPLPYVIRIGWDPTEAAAYTVAQRSMRVRTAAPLDIQPIQLAPLQRSKLYTRPREQRDGRWWDVVSGAPMSTEHAITRFFIPYFFKTGWILFTDGDMLCRADLAGLFAHADPQYALLCVQHPPLLDEGVKKIDAIQLAYPRKNWSSVILFNCGHPAHAALTLEMLNTLPGRDLHRFCWLSDDLIGALPAEWNYLVGVNPAMANPSLVHFTLGTPNIPGYEQSPFADEWRAAADAWSV